MAREVDDAVKRAVTRHWARRAAHFDEDVGHAIKTAAESAAWNRILDLILCGRSELQALDVGCGTGFLSLELAARGHQVTGVDLACEMLDEARQKALRLGLAVAFEEADAEALPFVARRFDLVLCRHLLWTLPHPQIAVAEWVRVLRPGGRLAVVESKAAAPAEAPPPTHRENARTSPEYRAIRAELPFFDGAARADVEALLRAQGLVEVGGEALADLLAAENERLAQQGFVPPHRERYLVTGIRPG